MKLSKRFFLLALVMVFLSLSVGSAANPNDVIKLKVNDAVFDVELENNSATQELMKTLKNGNVTINASDYGNFEKVGELGFSLPTSDENVNTAPGDIVLYQGNQISLFYDSHSWSYTKIGKIQNVDSNQLKNVLGSGDVKLTLSLK